MKWLLAVLSIDAMIDRRELLLGAVALATCAAQPRAPSSPPRRWAPFASTVAIDGASVLDLLAWDLDDKTTAEIAKANLEVAHACGLTAIAKLLGGNFARVLREVWG